MDVKVNVFKRTNGKFYMQYRVPSTDTKVVRSTGKTVRRDAERVASDWEKELRAGFVERPGQISWQEFRDRYEDEHLPSLAIKSDKKSVGVLNVFTKVCQPKRLADVTEQTLSKYAAKLRADGLPESTIASHIRTIGAALRWAADNKLLTVAPKPPKIERAKGKKMKGRAITGEEFDRMLSQVDAIAGEAAMRERVAKHHAGLRKSGRNVKASGQPTDEQVEYANKRAESWRFYLNGLYLSGLRLGESLNLTWDDETKIRIDLTGKYPVLLIPAEMQKSGIDGEYPIAPEFAELLLTVPEAERTGYVFKPLPERTRRWRLSEQQVIRTVSAIGEAAGVVVNVKPRKFASAHDLRRAFGTRWAKLLMPAELQALMRHSSITTTMDYYVSRNAQDAAATLWQAHEKRQQGEESPAVAAG